MYLLEDEVKKVWNLACDYVRGVHGPCRMALEVYIDTYNAMFAEVGRLGKAVIENIDCGEFILRKVKISGITVWEEKRSDSRSMSGTKSERKYKMIKITCRQTKAGAYTAIMKMRRNPRIKISVEETSKSGNHWTETVEGPDGEMFAVKDISNSGKHNCFFAIIDSSQQAGYRISHQTEPGDICRVCGPYGAR